MTDEQACAYIAGFFDGEGHIGHHMTARGQWLKSVSFCNTDRTLIDFMISLLRQVGIPTRTTFSEVNRPGWASRWTVYIAGGRPSFERFQRLIPIQAPDKVAGLRCLLESYAVPEVIAEKKRNGTIRPCEVCASPVYSSLAFQRRGGGRYCSRKCRGMAQRKRVTLSCTMCNQRYEVNAGRARKSRFCSARCFGHSQSDRVRLQAQRAALARWSPAGAA